jgi:type I restriction enzyme S subunit
MKDNWMTKRVEEFGDLITGSTPSTKISNYWDGEIPFYSPADFKGKSFCFDTERTITKIGLKTGRKLPINSILFTCIGSIGKMAINGKVGISNQQINAVVVKEEFDFKYIYYLLYHFKNRFKNFAPMTTIQIINKTEFGLFEFTLPPFPQQKKIANILSTCDEVIEKTEAAIAKYQALKQGMMHDLFTRGIDVNTGKLRPSYQDAPELYEESKLGMIPKEWDVINFEEATEIITDFTANGSFESLRINVKYYYEVNYGRLIRLTDLRQNLQTDGVYVDKAGFDYLAKSALRENDIMLANVGEYTGFACLMPKVNYPATMAPNMFLVRTNQELFDAKFMYYFMTFPSFTNQVDNVSASSATKLLNKTNFRAMELPKPSIDEQKLFGTSLEAINEKIQTEQSALAKYQQLKSGLMQDLLTGKVEVSVAEEILKN